MALTLRKIGVFWVALAIVCLCAFFPAHTAYADQGHNKVAPPEQMASSKALTLEGMKPITADQVKEGTYDIKAESSSSFFKIKGAKLIVRDGAMTAAISLDSKSYPLVYMGTGEDAAAAPAEDYIEFDGDSWTFTVPVSALDQEIDCAAYSKRKKQWYDRKLMFYAATLPEGAVLVDLPECFRDFRIIRSTIVSMMSWRIFPLTVWSVHLDRGSRSRYSLLVLNTTSMSVLPKYSESSSFGVRSRLEISTK